MTEPQIAIMMLVIFILSIFLGFPVAFTLMAMAVIFGYYAYFDPDRMWRSYDRAVQQAENATPEQIAAGDVAGSFELTLQYLGGFLNNRIFDLFVNQTFSVMSNDVLTAIPLFLFMGYVVERANIVTRLFDTLYVTAKGLPGAMAVAALATCALFATATGIIGAVVTLMGMLALPSMLRARYDTSFASGVICAGGCLGILIPPSIMLIVYAATSNV
ncbi:MAG: TRAP transporter large permease subunit, partial [Pseudomonadota bacterium]